MKKLLLVLALLGLCACSSSKAPKIKVNTAKIEIAKDSLQAEYREDVCAAITVLNADGSEADCSAVFFANPIDTATEGEYTLSLIYKDDAAGMNAEKDVTVVVVAK